MSEFSEWLAQQMDAQDVGQRELAKMVGLGHNSVKTWLSGFSVPSWQNCRLIADALGANREYVRQLCGYIDPEDEPAPQNEPEARELLAIYADLNQRGQDALFEVARALRQTQRATRRNGRAQGAD